MMRARLPSSSVYQLLTVILIAGVIASLATRAPAAMSALAKLNLSLSLSERSRPGP
jgi:hypothetical protein